MLSEEAAFELISEALKADCSYADVLRCTQNECEGILAAIAAIEDPGRKTSCGLCVKGRFIRGHSLEKDPPKFYCEATRLVLPTTIECVSRPYELRARKFGEARARLRNLYEHILKIQFRADTFDPSEAPFADGVSFDTVYDFVYCSAFGTLVEMHTNGKIRTNSTSADRIYNMGVEIGMYLLQCVENGNRGMTPRTINALAVSQLKSVSTLLDIWTAATGQHVYGEEMTAATAFTTAALDASMASSSERTEFNEILFYRALLASFAPMIHIAKDDAVDFDCLADVAESSEQVMYVVNDAIEEEGCKLFTCSSGEVTDLTDDWVADIRMVAISGTTLGMDAGAEYYNHEHFVRDIEWGSFVCLWRESTPEPIMKYRILQDVVVQIGDDIDEAQVRAIVPGDGYWVVLREERALKFVDEFHVLANAPELSDYPLRFIGEFVEIEGGNVEFETKFGDAYVKSISYECGASVTSNRTPCEYIRFDPTTGLHELLSDQGDTIRPFDIAPVEV
jgi:hypothetical protein